MKITFDIQSHHINFLKEQNEELRAQLDECQKFIKRIPILITNARLDAKENKETKLDYDLINRLCGG